MKPYDYGKWTTWYSPYELISYNEHWVQGHFHPPSGTCGLYWWIENGLKVDMHIPYIYLPPHNEERLA